jgi:hypothetical protein
MLRGWSDSSHDLYLGSRHRFTPVAMIKPTMTMIKPTVIGTGQRLADRELVRGMALSGLVVLGGLLAGYAIAEPSAKGIKLLLVGGVVCAAALAIPAHVFLPVILLVTGVSTSFTSPVVSAGPAVYVSDVVVLLVFIRGVAPHARRTGLRPLRGLPQALFLIWLVLLMLAAVRAMLDGIALKSVVRADLALFYWPILYFGFVRTAAEVDLDRRVLWRNLALVAVGLAFYSFVARALNHPFHDPGLALVPTGNAPEQTIPRNFGFAAAFVIYPLLAIAAVAVLASAATSRLRWTVLAGIGVIATLTTLVRGEILGLGLGLVAVLWVARPQWAPAGRIGTVLRLACGAVLAILVVLAVDPKLGDAVIQRALPFTHQAAGAQQTASYRWKAITTGINVARAHPLGIGVLDVRSLLPHGIDTGYLAHSGFTLLLVFGGWPALVAAFLTVLAVVRRSFVVPPASNWLQPGFVGVLAMLTSYSFGAAGLAGDAWVIPLGALAVALRFGLRPDTT